MSYIPIIVIAYDQLEANQSDIEDMKYKVDAKMNKKNRSYYTEQQSVAIDTLIAALHLEPYNLQGLKMVQIMPGLSSINRMVREMLTGLKIAYAVIS